MSLLILITFWTWGLTPLWVNIVATVICSLNVLADSCTKLIPKKKEAHLSEEDLTKLKQMIECCCNEHDKQTIDFIRQLLKEENKQ